MTKLMTTLTIASIASILVIGGFVASPEAYSTYGGWYDDDDDDDDCGHYGYYGHHDDDDDDCGNNEPKDPCDCEKPDTLKFKFTTPDSETSNEFKIEIYKKLNYIGNEDKKLTSIADVTHMGDYQIESSSFGKDKLNSNTVFAIYKTVENADDVLVSSIEIHTSCSQDLYIGQTRSDGGYSLEITDGFKNGETSISASNPQTCGDEPEPEKTGTIVIKNALTNDNGGEAEFTDFSYKVTNEIGEEIDLVQDSLDPSIHVGEVPKGPYILSQTIAPTITGTYTEVLITGDKKCPATTNESFMIKKDKTVSCTIYNDDNDDGSSGEGGIIFRNFSMQVKLGDNMMANSCDLIPNAIDKNACVEIVNPSDGRFAIVDSALTSDTTIVLFSVLEAEQLESDTGAQSPACNIEAIVQHDKPSFFLVDQSDNESFPTNPSTNNVVVIKCAGTNMNSVYNVNYIMIDPTL